MKKTFIFFIIIILFFSFFSCSIKEEGEGLSLYGGVVHNSDYTHENGRYTFLYDMIEDADGGYAILSMTEKISISSRIIPVFPTDEKCYIHRLFVTNDYLYVPRTLKSSGIKVIERIDLKDFSVERIFEETNASKKVFFGLAFSFEQFEAELSIHPDFVFSNDKDVFFSDQSKGVFKIMPDKTAKNIIADEVRYDVVYDGEYIFYVTNDGILKQYEIKSGKTVTVSDKTVTPYTLKVTKEDITFESDKEKVTIKR